MLTEQNKPLLSIVIFLSFFLWPSLIFSAQGQTKTMTSTISQKIQTQALLTPGVPEQDRTNVGEMNIIVSDRRYNIINATKVFIGPKDQELSINELPVPCEAKITYQLTGNDPNILQIKVLKILPGASISWHKPQPE